jgi:hypothetical protein
MQTEVSFGNNYWIFKKAFYERHLNNYSLNHLKKDTANSLIFKIASAITL